jgi:hypothetical protein
MHTVAASSPAKEGQHARQAQELIAKAVISLDDTPDGYMYKEFDPGAAKKYVNMTGKA